MYGAISRKIVEGGRGVYIDIFMFFPTDFFQMISFITGAEYEYVNIHPLPQLAN